MDVNVHSDEALLSSGGRLGRRRRWSSAEKRQIVEESLAGNRQASLTARRHGIPHSLLFRWRKAYQEGRLGESDEPVSLALLNFEWAVRPQTPHRAKNTALLNFAWAMRPAG